MPADSTASQYGVYLTYDEGATMFDLYKPSTFSVAIPTARVSYLGTPACPAKLYP